MSMRRDSGYSARHASEHPDHLEPKTRLRFGTRIPTMYGFEVRVLRYIGGGGQGDVYEVAYNGERKALKWYRDGVFIDRNSFISNLKRNIEHGSPHSSFVWPLDITDYYQDTFGYVMDLIPQEYIDVDSLLLNNTHFTSYRRVIDACMSTVSAFRMLHNEGYSYQDVNMGNLVINPNTGKVLICDNDNVAPNNVSTGVLGTLGFMAPEIVNGSLPDEESDLYSLAVLIFLLLFRVHPLEGRRALRSVLTDEEKMRLFGHDALFVFDAQDDSNSLDPTIESHASALVLWSCMPSHFKAFLRRAFSQASLHKRHRPIEAEWITELTRLRSEMLACPNCGSEVFFDRDLPMTCDGCGTSLAPRLLLDIGRQSDDANGLVFLTGELPVAFDTRIYRTQVCTCDVSDALKLDALIVKAHDEDVYGIQNLSGIPWHVLENSQVTKTIDANAIETLYPGLSILIEMPQLGNKSYKSKTIFSVVASS